MRLLLDTHVLLWWVTNDRQLSASARSHIVSAENDVAVSAASFWELAIKKELRRIEIDLAELRHAIAADGMTEVPVGIAHTLRLNSLPALHRDPFDRILIVQAIDSAARLLTRDEQILAYAGTAGFDTLRV